MSADTLPIDSILADIQQALATRHELVLEAPPGAGKSTHVPLALLDQRWLYGRILLLEPRRMAARAVAQRMADLLGEKVGVRVGYRIRQESRVSEHTRIEVVTGGVLTRLLQDDPALSSYSLLIFDEFHERSLDSDLALALALQGRELLRDETDPLKILVMSATLDGAAIANLFGGAPLLRSEGRVFPVAVNFADTSGGKLSTPDLIQTTCRTILRALTDHTGSVLVFLPGQREILNVQNELRAALTGQPQLEGVQIAPLYGSLGLADQQMAIHPVQPPYHRKVVLATDIAETSLTIEGVNIVVDTGLHRAPEFDPRAGLTRLQTLRISQSSATQRAGRAGRLAPGVCYRLWREDETLVPFTKPEILQADLAPMALQMLAFGVADPQTLTWLTPPPAGAFDQAMNLLESLGAIVHNGNQCALTAHGRAMAVFPAHPRLAHMMLRGAVLGLGRAACALAAALEESGRPAQLGTDVEHWLAELLHSARSSNWVQRARQQIRQFEHLLPPSSDAPSTESRINSTTETPATIPTSTGLLLALAYPDRIARQRHANQPLFQLANGRGAALDEQDAMTRQTWLAVAEVGGFAGRRDDRIFAAAALDPTHFDDALQDLVTVQEVVEWSAEQQRFIAERRWCVGSLTWRQQKLVELAPERKQQALAAFIRARGLELLPWEDSHRQWRARVQLLRDTACSGADLPPWPDLSDEALLRDLQHWLAPFLADVNKLDDLRRVNLTQALTALLPWPLPARLDEWAPAHISVPSGSRIGIDYTQNPPVLAVKLQEMFGCESTPTVAQGRVVLLVHLLSPAQRPLQVTQDLAGFWRSGYHEVKKEMKGRYPKHPWPDDPLQAVATRFTKNRAEPR